MVKYVKRVIMVRAGSSASPRRRKKVRKINRGFGAGFGRMPNFRLPKF